MAGAAHKTSKELQANLEQSGVVVSACTIQHKLHEKDKPQSFWDNVVQTDETKAELPLIAVHQFVYR